MNPRVTPRFAAAFLLTFFSVTALAEPASVSGKVLDSETNAGLRKAYLRLFAGTKAYAAVSDDSGKFSFDGVEPGTYNMEAEHQGYIDGSYGESESQSVKIKVDAGQSLKGIDIRLTPQGAISGRVVNEEGDLWVHARVDLYRSEWVAGRRKLQNFNSERVNDLGEFRIGELPPGRYYLAVEPDTSWEIRNQLKGKDVSARQLTWYPGSLDAAEASPIVLATGGQVLNLEIRIRRGTVHRVQGTLIGLGDMPTERSGAYFGGQGVFASPLSENAGSETSGTVRPNGTFEIEGLAPGNYEIRVNQGFPPFLVGRTKVRIDSRDVDDLTIQVTPPKTVKGRVQFAEASSSGGPPLKLDRLSVRLDPNMGLPVFATTDANGTFEFPRVGSDEYQVVVNHEEAAGSGRGYYLKQIRYGDAISNDGTITMPAAGPELLIVLSTRGARLTGTLTGEAAHPQVVLIPAAGQPRLGTFDQTHQFLFQDIPPGAYKLYAFDGVPGGAWEDAEFMKEVGSSATDLDLGEGDVKSVEIPVFPKADMARIVKKLGME
jgi:hypothetical protein